MRSRVAALWDRPLHRPQGVAIVGIYPCGKARKRRPGPARIKQRIALWNYGRHGETDHGVKPVLAPGGRADEQSCTESHQPQTHPKSLFPVGSP